LEIGNVVPFTNEDGSKLNGQLIEITDTDVTVDFNHMLAGKAMHFEGKVIGVREATTSELEHGHVHGGVNH
ncbi:MAG: FKBP-type peptidyl-prolyl cis-trans isomerase SlyD, partial [Oceanospirillaceae bacterium]